MDFNATTHGQCDIDDDRVSNLIEAISTKRLGLEDVEADIIGKSYEYLICKFAEGGGQSAGEFYTPPEVGTIMSRVMQPEPGMTVYDPCCGSGGLLVKLEIAMESRAGKTKPAPLKLYGQEYTADTWAMVNMNMIIHDMEGEIEIGDTFKNPKFRQGGKLRTFDRVVANLMLNQDWFTENDYDNDELDRFLPGAGFSGKSSTGSVGDSYDNALAETINGLYKIEIIHKRAPWKTVDEVEYATLEWVDWFNKRLWCQPQNKITK